MLHRPCVSFALLIGALLLTLMALGGCGTVGALVGGMAESANRQGSSSIEARYTGLEGKSFAVVVAADRAIQADYPDVVARICVLTSARLSKEAKAGGFVPGERVLEWQFNNPRWTTMPMSELASKLGVQRLVYVDLIEYRLHDPGNAYLWAGVASANVGVIEADSTVPEDFAFQTQIQVQFPTDEGFGPSDIPFEAVNSELSRRVIDRASWLFYPHEEPNTIEY